MTHAPLAKHLPQLDGLRGLAAGYVVLGHASLQIWPPEYRVAIPPVIDWPLCFVHYSVTTFLVLSGFCLGLPVIRRNVSLGGNWRFLTGRFRRIVPPYWTALAVSIILVLTLIGQPTGTHWDVATLWTWKTLAACVILCPELFGWGSFNHVLWSVGVETKIYCLFPLIVTAWRRVGLLLTILAVSALALSLSCLAVGTAWHRLTLWYIPLFLLGVGAAAIAAATDPLWGRWQQAPWGSLALVGVGLGLAGKAEMLPVPTATQVSADLLAGLVAAAGLISITTRPSWFARLLATRPVVFVGTFAYSLYLMHAPLLQLVHQYLIMPLQLDRSAQFAVLVGFGGPLILGAAWIFYRLAERPWMSSRLRQAVDGEQRA